VYFDEHPCFILHTKRQKEPGKTIDGRIFGTCEIGTGQHVAQIHDSYMMMMKTTTTTMMMMLMMMLQVFDA
jgi:hypothetical protein